MALNNTVTVPTKPIWASKTFWFNLVTMVLAALGTLQTAVAALPFVTPKVAASVATACVVVNAVGNIILRLVSTQPVSVTGNSTAEVKTST